ncbi:hypothetical protein ACH4UM_26210 [Streptomyces sp. NPDC020801]|uniref:hypothetical protein n=1 Tax=unclassified Streptomyces TaxID=2593676 RepID=UPI00379ECFB3
MIGEDREPAEFVPLAGAAGQRTGGQDAGPWAGFGPVVAVPIGTGMAVRGVLLLARHRGRPVFGVAETGPPAGSAGHAAVAIGGRPVIFGLHTPGVGPQDQERDAG